MRVNITSALAVCLVLLLRFESPAAAQEPPPLSPPPQLQQQHLKLSAVVWSAAWLVGVNAAIDASTGLLVYKFLGSRHPRLATLAFYGAAAYRTYLSIHNVQMMEKARAVTIGRP